MACSVLDGFRLFSTRRFRSVIVFSHFPRDFEKWIAERALFFRVTTPLRALFYRLLFAEPAKTRCVCRFNVVYCLRDFVPFTSCCMNFELERVSR